jgi:predicted urease superfamily metal-dependent hydrolase
MKITNRQLRKIIKEEKAKLVSEMGFRHPKTGEDLLLMLNDVVDKLMDAGMDTDELAGELRGLADDVEDSRYVNMQNSAYRNEDA